METASRRWYLKKRVVVPVALCALVAAGMIRFLAPALRIDDADAGTAAPPGSGTHAQLVRRPDGRVVLRCRALVAAPPERVWAVVTGYERFPSIFPMLSEAQAVRETDGRVLFRGVARTLVGSVPFGTRIRHEEGAVRRASWDEPGGMLSVCGPMRAACSPSCAECPGWTPRRSS
jgi:hypothetical protein